MRASVLILYLAAGGVLLGACGAKSGSGPVWPKSAGRVEVDPKKDGGETLEPKHGSNVGAVERSDDPTPVVDEEANVVEAPPPKAEETPVLPPPPP